jgi:tRNA nucleotidyltransferase (CCA-adding enzyme)
MNKKHTDLMQQVLEKITPSTNDRDAIKKALNAFTEQLTNELSSYALKPTITLVGSIAKDTYLKNTLDLDVFLLFSPDVPKDTIASTTLSIGRKLLKDSEECYAEHPYIRGMFQSFKFELVPGYKIKDASQKISAVDRTPLHTTYVINHLSNDQKDDVRLLKQFLHGIGCYGAEAETQGFSGYLCEILIIKFKTFHNLLKASRNWQPKIIISLNNASIPSFPEPFIFIDPVDSERNVASAVAYDTLNLYIKACGAYLDNPKMTFFFPNKIKPWSIQRIKEEINKNNNQYIGVIFEKPDLINENLYPQLRRVGRVIVNESKNEDFKIEDTTFYVDDKNHKVYIIIKTKNELLSKTKVHMGPPTHLLDHKNKFNNKWNQHEKVVTEPYEKNGRMYVEIERLYRDLLTYLRENIKSFHMGRFVEAELQSNGKIVSTNDLLIEQLREFWTQYLENKQPWEW